MFGMATFVFELNSCFQAIMVIMALATTLLTTPLIRRLYPCDYAKRATQKHALRDPEARKSEDLSASDTAMTRGKLFRPLICLPGVNTVHSMMTLTRIICPCRSNGAPEQRPSSSTSELGLSDVHVLRLVEITERFSSLIMAVNIAQTIAEDVALNIFAAFARIIQLSYRLHLRVSESRRFAEQVCEVALHTSSSIIFLPWQRFFLTQAFFDASPQHELVWDVLNGSKCCVAVFVDRHAESEISQIAQEGCSASILNTSSVQDASRILVPFFGGPDDREALMLAVRIAQEHPGSELIVLRLSSILPKRRSIHNLLDTLPKSSTMTLPTAQATVVAAGSYQSPLLRETTVESMRTNESPRQFQDMTSSIEDDADERCLKDAQQLPRRHVQMRIEEAGTDEAITPVVAVTEHLTHNRYSLIVFGHMGATRVISREEPSRRWQSGHIHTLQEGWFRSSGKPSPGRIPDFEAASLANSPPTSTSTSRHAKSSGVTADAVLEFPNHHSTAGTSMYPNSRLSAIASVLGTLGEVLLRNEITTANLIVVRKYSLTSK